MLLESNKNIYFTQMQYLPGAVMPIILATSEFAGSLTTTSPFQLRENCASLQMGHELPVTNLLQFLQTFSFVVIFSPI